MSDDCVSQIHISRSASYLKKEFFGNGESQTEPFVLRIKSLQFTSPSLNEHKHQDRRMGKVKVRLEIKYPKSKSAREIQSIVNQIRTNFKSGVVPLGTVTTNSEKTAQVSGLLVPFFSLPRIWPFSFRTPISAKNDAAANSQ
jgi:hypothetical protein